MDTPLLNRAMKAATNGSGRPIIDVTDDSKPAAEDLRDVVKESQARLAEAEQAGIKPKRGRGRHPKGCQCGKCSQSVSQTGPGSATAASPSQNGNPQSPPGPAVPSLVPFLKPAVEMPFAAAAASTGFGGWELTPPEAQSLTEQLDAVLRVYMPAMDPNRAQLGMLAISLSMCAGGRYLAYKQWQRQQVEAKPAPPAQGFAAEPAQPAQPAQQAVEMPAEMSGNYPFPVKLV